MTPQVPDKVIEKAWLDRHGYTHVLELGLFEEFRNGFLAGMKYRDEQYRTRNKCAAMLEIILSHEMPENTVKLMQNGIAAAEIVNIGKDKND